MNVLLISYDLGAPETSDDYADLIKQIKKHAWCKPEYSMWFIKTTKSVTAIRDELKAYLDSNDKLLVMDVSDDNWASFRLPSSVTDWMKESI